MASAQLIEDAHPQTGRGLQHWDDAFAAGLRPAFGKVKCRIICTTLYIAI